MLERTHLVSRIPPAGTLLIVAFGSLHKIGLEQVVLDCDFSCGRHHSGNVRYREWASRLAILDDALLWVHNGTTPE